METYEEMREIVQLKKGQLESYANSMTTLEKRDSMIDRHLSEYKLMKQVLEEEIENRSSNII